MYTRQTRTCALLYFINAVVPLMLTHMGFSGPVIFWSADSHLVSENFAMQLLDL